MKKTFMILVSMMLLFTTIAFADESPLMTDSFRFETFGDAVVSMEEGDAFTVSDGNAVAVLIRNGRCFRVVASFDGRAEELYKVYHENGNFTNDEYQEFYEHIKTLTMLFSLVNNANEHSVGTIR